MRHGKTKVEHEANRLVVQVGFPAVAGQKFEVGGGQARNHLGKHTGDNFGFFTASQNTADKQARSRIALFVQQIEEVLVALQKRDLVGIRVEGEGPLQDGAATSPMTDGRKFRQTTDAVGRAVWVFVNQAFGESDVAEGRGEENIRRRAVIEKAAAYRR